MHKLLRLFCKVLFYVAVTILAAYIFFDEWRIAWCASSLSRSRHDRECHIAVAVAWFILACTRHKWRCFTVNIREQMHRYHLWHRFVHPCACTSTCMMITAVVEQDWARFVLARTCDIFESIGIGIYLGCFFPGGNSAHNTIIMNKSRHSHQKMGYTLEVTIGTIESYLERFLLKIHAAHSTHEQQI